MEIQFTMESASDPELTQLLNGHAEEMRRISPPESAYVLDASEVDESGITLWAARVAGELVGCGALRAIEPGHAELKSVHVCAAWRSRGLGEALVRFLAAEAGRQGCTRLSLETGSTEPFAAVRRLYERVGFEPCGLFGDYSPDPHSAYMALDLTPS